jgi:methylated-DNA-[protein]-cysteine S-methyltransferase
MPGDLSICNYSIVNMFYAFVATAEVSSQRGPVRIAATERGVAAVELLSTPEGFASGLARRGLVVDAEQAGRRAVTLAAEAATAVAAFLDGEPAALEGLPIDIADRPAWDRLVLDAVRAIPRGHTAGYGDVARRIGRPGAARAVGGAVGRNPVGLLFPCHRVIAGDGTLGGYGAAAWGGREAALDLKRELLALEGVEVRCGRVSAG